MAKVSLLNGIAFKNIEFGNSIGWDVCIIPN